MTSNGRAFVKTSNGRLSYVNLNGIMNAKDSGRVAAALFYILRKASKRRCAHAEAQAKGD